MRVILLVVRRGWLALSLASLAALLLALDPGAWAALVAIPLALLALLAFLLPHQEGSEAALAVFLAQGAAFVLLGAAAAGLAHALGVERVGTLVAFLSPAFLLHAWATARALRRRDQAIGATRLATLPTPALLAEVGARTDAPLLVDLVLEREGGREAVLEAARALGDGPARRGALEVAVHRRKAERRLSLEVARSVLADPEAPPALVGRALVAVWDAADPPLLALLRERPFADAALRLAALEVRARSRDPRVLEDWLAGSDDSEEAAPSLALALAEPPGPERLAALRAPHAEGTPARARLAALEEALARFA